MGSASSNSAEGAGMETEKYILKGMTPENIDESLDEICQLIQEYGVVILPNFFTSDNIYLKWYKDLQKTLAFICENYSLEMEVQELGESLTEILKLQPEIGQLVANLGTQSNKFASFNELKYSGAIPKIAETFFGENSLVLTPQAGDTFHIFPPGENFHRYNLPIHQDYQYLMQSPSQLTFYLGISEYRENVGGLKFWEKSHLNGIVPTGKNGHGSYELKTDAIELSQFKEVNRTWNSGDLGIFHSLLWHASIPNTSDSNTRVVQIFRLSDCNNEIAKSYNFQSTSYHRRGVDFPQIHSELFSS